MPPPTPEAERVDAYLATIGHSEPDIAMIDHDAAMASVAISLRRLADLREIEVLAEALRRSPHAEPAMLPRINLLTERLLGDR